MGTITTLTLLLMLSVYGSYGQQENEQAFKDNLRQEIQKSFHEGYKAAIRDSHRKNGNSIEKRYNVATLNQAARNANPLLGSVGGDPYGMGNTMLSTQHVTYGKKKRSAVQETRSRRYIASRSNALKEAYASGYAETRSRRYIASRSNALKEAYASGYAAGKEVVDKMQKEKQDPEKRFGIEKLNQAARHRNVYFDAVGGDPYGGSSVVSSRQHVNWNHGKRSV